jgi:hypothetical protein
MLEQVIAAPFALIKRPALYVWALFLVLIQGAILLVFGETLGYFSTTLADFSFPLNIEFLSGGIIFLFSTSIPIYLHASLAQRMNKDNRSNTIPFGLAGSSFLMGIVMSVVGLCVLGIGLFMSGVIGLTGGFLSLLGVILFFILGALVFFALVKFMYAPTFLGRGFPIKEAFSESWKITTGKFFPSILVALILLIVGVFLGSIPEVLPIDASNEWINLIISSIFAGLAGSFSGVTLALIAGKDTNTFSNARRHAHKK